MADKRIGVLVDEKSAMGHGIMLGVAAYAQGRPDWLIGNMHRDNVHRSRTSSPPTLDAVIGVIAPEIAELWPGEQRRFAVNISRGRHIDGAANVTCDDAAIARLAAEHLLSKPVEQLAYLGMHAGARQDEFMRAVRRAGRRAQAVVVEARDDSLAEPLKALPASTGLFVFNDEWAHQVVRIARESSISIPRDLAVVGVDNDEMASAFAPVPLTSVDPDFQRVGYEAAAWLDRIFQGEPPPVQPVRIPPRGLIERDSSDYPALTDELAVQAARLIRRRACDGLTVEQIPDFLPATYWTVNRRFQAAFGRTLHEQIIATRIDEAARLLRTTRLPVMEICARAGFGNVKHFSTVFRREIGQSPAAYRRAKS